MRVALDPLLALKSKMFVVKNPKKKISESSMLLFNQEIIKIVIT